jgi:protein phosphatase
VVGDGANESTLPSDTGRSDARVDCAGSTHTGYVRGRNEDRYLLSPERGLFVVADGLGGHPAGDVASRIAIETLDYRLEAQRLGDDPGGSLDDALRAAHDAINDEARRTPETEGMGTTIVASWTDGQQLVIASVGDSRAYRLRDGSMTQVTTDDVWEAAFGRSLTQALGGSGEVTPEVADLKLEPGDRVLLCTDGLTDMLDDELIADVLGAPMVAQEVVDRLTACALDHGGYDNITTIVLIAPE